MEAAIFKDLFPVSFHFRGIIDKVQNKNTKKIFKTHIYIFISHKT